MKSLLIAAAVVIAFHRPRAHEVAIQAFQFQPKAIEVTAGTRVVWTNRDDIEHTVTADSSGGGVAFDGALGGKGRSFAFTFTLPGTYAYFCARHTFMRGTVRVTPKGDR